MNTVVEVTSRHLSPLHYKGSNDTSNLFYYVYCLNRRSYTQPLGNNNIYVKISLKKIHNDKQPREVLLEP